MPANQLKLAIDNASAALAACTVPIFVESAKTSNAAVGVGSGFVVLKNGQNYLVTAQHVLTQITKHECQIANIANVGVALSGLSFSTYSLIDVACAELSPAWLQTKGIVGFASAEAKSYGEEWTRMGCFVVMGYPATRNQLDMRYGKVDRNLRSYVLARHKGKVPTDIASPILLAYDPRDLVEFSGNEPDVHGMSGGPCFEVLLRKDPYGIAMDVVGVVTELCAQQKAIVVSPFPL